MTVRIMIGDALSQLAELPDESVHFVMTSPPYWNLRSYKGGDGMIGLEPTFDAHLENLVAVFREVRRVLRSDGTLWLNYGDAYASGSNRSVTDSASKQATYGGNVVRKGATEYGLKPKDLMMMPARVAWALQADGWWLRSEIIWHKSNPMPESTRDRPASAHEKVFLLSKSGDTLFWTHSRKHGVRTKPEPDYYWRNRKTHVETDVAPPNWRELVDEDDKRIWARINRWCGHDYFYDSEAVRVPMADSSISRLAQNIDGQVGSKRAHEGRKSNGNMKAVGGKQRGHERRHDGFNDRWDAMTKDEQQSGGANLRNVWKIATHSFSEAHFATFPPALVEPCIKAGTSEHGVCGQCGAPWAREVVASGGTIGQAWHDHKSDKISGHSQTKHSLARVDIGQGKYARETIGWSASCNHDAPTVPATILDPFGGAGTVGLVADRFQRDAILIEISPDYAKMAQRRIEADAGGLFSSVVVG